MKIESLDHIHICSEDPNFSAQFYEKNFEATEVLRKENSRGQERVFLSLGGQMLVIGPYPPGTSAHAASEVEDGGYTPRGGIAHLGIRVQDIEDAVEELENQGVRLIRPLTHESPGLSYTFIAAPDGVTIELTQYG